MRCHYAVANFRREGTLSETQIKSPSRRRRKTSEASRTRILDAAEDLFSVSGFVGVTLREITRQADVPLALVNYHFGSKDELFVQVVKRRAAEHTKRIKKRVHQVVASHENSLPPVSELLRAYMGAIVEISRIDEGWANYSRLAARSSELRSGSPHSEALLDHYFPLINYMIELLHKSAPTLSREDIHWSFYFFECALIQFMAESGLVDRQSNGLCESSDLEKIVEKMAPFFAAGFYKFA